MIMKAISIRQPWAWLILNAGKDIENRTWRTNYRGFVLIHASAKVDAGAYELFRERSWKELPPIKEIHTGGIVGMAEIVGCVNHSISQWFQGPYGFELTHQTTLPFFKCRGSLSFFPVNYPDEFFWGDNNDGLRREHQCAR